jgi:hypothetical protein
VLPPPFYCGRTAKLPPPLCCGCYDTFFYNTIADGDLSKVRLRLSLFFGLFTMSSRDDGAIEYVLTAETALLYLIEDDFLAGAAVAGLYILAILTAP